MKSQLDVRKQDVELCTLTRYWVCPASEGGLKFKERGSLQ